MFSAVSKHMSRLHYEAREGVGERVMGHALIITERRFRGTVYANFVACEESYMT